MTIYQPELQIAVGYNNVAGLVAIEAITPSGDRPFLPVRSFGTFDTGQRKVRMTGRPYFSGFISAQFLSAGMTIAQFKYLKTTYCSNGYSGLVTVRLRLDDPATYGNYNATLILPKENEMTYRGGAYEGVVWSFVDLEVIP